MLKNRIIPCLDVKNGRVVKGINFVDLQDAGDPVEQAKIYSDGGADDICFLDITASNENRDIIYDVVEKTSKKCFVPLTVGGGVRNVEDINKLLNCGADKVSINTAAVENSRVVIDSSKKFGSQCIVIVDIYIFHTSSFISIYPCTTNQQYIYLFICVLKSVHQMPLLSS